MIVEARPSSSRAIPKTQARSPAKPYYEGQYWRSFSSSHQRYMQDNFPLDKLDLIFRKEPKEIQNKIVELLLRYNANMLYNKDSDMFEVDLLIPFQNQQQKRQFIRQFLQIRRQHHYEHTKNANLETPLPEKQRSEEIEWIGEIRKFSFSNNGEEAKLEQRSRTQSKGTIQISSNGENGPINATKDVIFPPEEIQKQYKLNIQYMRQVIDRRLKNVTAAIKAESKMKVNQFDQHQVNTLDVSCPPKEESIIDQIANSISLGSTEKIGQSKLLNISGLKQQLKIDPQQHVPYSFNEDTLRHRKPSEFNFSAERPYNNQIVEEAEEDDYEPLFPGKQKHEQSQHMKNRGNEGKMTTFEDYQKKYASINETKQNKGKNKDRDRKYSGSINNKSEVPSSTSYYSQKNPVSNIKLKKSNAMGYNVQKNINKSKRDLQQSHRRSTKEIQIFFNTYRKSLDKLYSEVRGRIQRNPPLISSSSSALEKSLESLYILVLDEQSSSQMSQTASQKIQTRKFKQQMIKQYQREVILMNRNLSSEDLVAYFKYLHSNAYKLYLRYLKNKTK